MSQNPRISRHLGHNRPPGVEQCPKKAFTHPKRVPKPKDFKALGTQSPTRLRAVSQNPSISRHLGHTLPPGAEQCPKKAFTRLKRVPKPKNFKAFGTQSPIRLRAVSQKSLYTLKACPKTQGFQDTWDTHSHQAQSSVPKKPLHTQSVSQNPKISRHLGHSCTSGLEQCPKKAFTRPKYVPKPKNFKAFGTQSPTGLRSVSQKSLYTPKACPKTQEFQGTWDTTQPLGSTREP